MHDEQFNTSTAVFVIGVVVLADDSLDSFPHSQPMQVKWDAMNLICLGFEGVQTVRFSHEVRAL